MKFGNFASKKIEDILKKIVSEKLNANVDILINNLQLDFSKEDQLVVSIKADITGAIDREDLKMLLNGGKNNEEN